MSDEIDELTTCDEGLIDAAVYEIRKKIKPIELNPGECLKCGKMVGRLIDGVCCPCVDRKMKLYVG